MSNRKIIKNIFSLSVADLISKIIIFIYTAYLARTILTDGLGTINLAQSLVAYLIVLTNGMDTYGVKMISKSKSNIKSFVNSVFSLRLFLSILGYVILIIIVLLLDKDIEVKNIILIFGITIFAQGTYINWIFMGMEKMEVIALRLIIMSLINFAGILLLISSPEDTWLAASIIGVSQLLNSIWMIVYYIKKYERIQLTFNFKEWLEHFKNSLPFGLTYIVISFYSNIGIILIGVLISTNYLYQTGILGSALKLMIIAMTPLQIIQLSFFPRLSASNTKEEKQLTMKSFTKMTYLVGSFLSVLVFFYSEILIGVAYGEAFAESSYLLKILAPAILFMYIGSSFNIPLMAWGKERTILYLVLTAALINFIINLIFIPIYGMYSVAYSTLITELVVVLIAFYFIYQSIDTNYLKNLISLISIAVVSFGSIYFLTDLYWIASLLISSIIFIILSVISKQLDLKSIKKLIVSK